jgi:hypothetical protein
MSKFVGLGLTLLFMLSAATTTQQPFAKYRKIEAYEIRLGIIMMPRYTADDEVCEIALEKLHYSPEVISVAPSLSREEIFQILDELVPSAERGKPSKNLTDNWINVGGHVMTTNMEFDNVSIKIYGATLPSRHKNETTVNEVVATVEWKQRVCR